MEEEQNSELLEWKRKYESTDQSLQTLKKLSHRAISDYEDLQRRYDQNQKQYDELKIRLQDTEYQLQALQRVLEPACEDYKQLQNLYEIEQGIRSEAEKYATNVVKQNHKLKRQSQMLLETIDTQHFPLEKLQEISIAEADIPEDGRLEEFAIKIEQLEENIESIQLRNAQVEDERDKAIEREHVLKRQIDQYQEALASAQEQILDHERTINNYSKISDQACSEYEDLRRDYEQEKRLREEAEKYASQILSQRDAVVRESSVLLASAAADQRLAEAFMALEDVQRELEEEKDRSRRTIRELEETIENDMSAKRIEDLEIKLEVATDEISRQQKQVNELQKWKQKLERDYQNIEQELDQTRQKLINVPPPPPPPPASLFSVFRPLKMKKKSSAGAAKKTAANPNQNQDFSKALEEMMSRIKSGTAVRPSAERRPSLPEIQTKGKSSAMEELNQLLGKIKRSNSVTDVENRAKQRQENNEDPQSDLQKAFLKVKGGKSANVGGANLSRIKEEDSGELSVSPLSTPKQPHVM